MKHRILIVDDDPISVKILKKFIESKGFEPHSAGTGKDGIEEFKTVNPSIVLLDLKLPDQTGIDLIPQMKSINDEIPIIMVSGSGDTQDIVSAMKTGASDYIQKPVDTNLLFTKIEKLLEMKRIESTAKELILNGKSGPIIGSSIQIRRLIRELSKISNSDAPVLISGESGTGKSMFAELIHSYSSRKNDPFININCSAIPANLLESELFGHVKGSFTGAVTDKQGKFEAANKGTIFLDEIGEISTDLQVKLLRVLQGQEFERVGSIKTIRVDVRVIAATNKNLDEAILNKSFREDLFYRLNVLPIYIPPLRERRDDIPALLANFLGFCSEKEGKIFEPLSTEIVEHLKNHDWPGNIRELQNVIERAVVFGREPSLKLSDFVVSQNDGQSQSMSVKKETLTSIKDIEYGALVKALEQSGGNISKASKRLGISRDTIYRRLKKFGISIK